MPQQTFNVSENVKIHVRGCRDRVFVTGWEQAHSIVVDAPARLEGDTLIVENARKVAIRAPSTAGLIVSDCSADLRIEGLSGEVELAGVRGDVVLRGLANVRVRDLKGDMAARGVATLRGEGAWDGDVSLRGVDHFEVATLEGDLSVSGATTTTIQSLEGDLAAHGIGSLHLGEVHGDVSVRGAEGELAFASVSGDLIASGVRGSINAEDISGDAVLAFEDVQGAVVRAHGDVVVHLPSKADADVELDAPHGDVVARVPIHFVEQDENHVRGTLGNGGYKVQIESLHDDVILRVGAGADSHPGRDVIREHFIDMGQDYAEMGRQIAEEARRSVQESLARSGIHARHHPHHEHGRRTRRSEDTDIPEPPRETKPSGPAAGSPERQAILDAIARGELSVDDAIRKIRGED